MTYADDVARTASIAAGLEKALDALVLGADRVGFELGRIECDPLTIVGDKKRKRCLAKQNNIFTTGRSLRRPFMPGKLISTLA